MSNKDDRDFIDRLVERLKLHDKMAREGYEMVIVPTIYGKAHGQKERTIRIPPSSQTKGGKK